MTNKFLTPLLFTTNCEQRSENNETKPFSELLSESVKLRIFWLNLHLVQFIPGAGSERLFTPGLAIKQVPVSS